MNLRVWMKQEKISYEKLSKMLGVTRQTVWKICKGYPCEPITAHKIYFLTDGKIKVKVKKRGAVKGSKRNRGNE